MRFPKLRDPIWAMPGAVTKAKDAASGGSGSGSAASQSTSESSGPFVKGTTVVYNRDVTGALSQNPFGNPIGGPGKSDNSRYYWTNGFCGNAEGTGDDNLLSVYRINWRADCSLNNLCMWNQRSLVETATSLVFNELGMRFYQPDDYYHHIDWRYLPQRHSNSAHANSINGAQYASASGILTGIHGYADGSQAHKPVFSTATSKSFNRARILSSETVGDGNEIVGKENIGGGMRGTRDPSTATDPKFGVVPRGKGVSAKVYRRKIYQINTGGIIVKVGDNTLQESTYIPPAKSCDTIGISVIQRS
jgi:hypothetical protein